MFIAGLAMILLFWGATELIRSWVSTGSNVEEELGAARIKNLQELMESNHTELESYAWVDQEKKIVRIPIKRAMELQVAAMQGSTPSPANLIDAEAAAPATPVTAPATDATPAEEVAPAASEEAVTEPAAAAPAPETTAPEPEATPVVE